MHEAHGDAGHHGDPTGPVPVADLDHHLHDYKKIITVLSVSTALEFGVSALMANGTMGLFLGIVVLVVIAFFKAVLVARFFMHLRYDPRPLAWIAVTPLMLATPLNVICCFDAIKGPAI
jgi:caa(3)-type oxidase subunit IV